jgi:hypothetical protein
VWEGNTAIFKINGNGTCFEEISAKNRLRDICLQKGVGKVMNAKMQTFSHKVP